MKKIVIIGGGISGLSTAYYLKKFLAAKELPVEITIIEKSENLGGQIVTIRKDGFTFETGPDCFISEKPWALRLCKEIGLENDFACTKEENKKTFILNKGRLDEMPEGFMMMVPTRIEPFLKSPLISFEGKIRMCMDLIIPRKKDNNDESLGSFVRRRLGEEVLDKIAEPLVAGIHAGNPETMSLKNTFPRFLEMEQKYGSVIKGMLAGMENKNPPISPFKKGGLKGDLKKTFFMSLKDGLAELTDKLQELLRPDIKIITNNKVLSISQSECLYDIETENALIKDVDIVIVTTPAYIAGHLVKNFDDELSSVLLDFPYASSATVSIGFKRSEVAHPLQGFGFLVPSAEHRKIMATTWTSSKWPYRAPEDCVLLRCFLGGAMNEKMACLPENEIIKTTLDEWKEIMGISAKPVIQKAHCWIKCMPQYVMGHEKTVEKIDKLASRHPGLIINGNYLRGVGIPDCIHNSELIAQKIAEFLKY
ncbi:MAG: protoporphyrinogen oxidase [bacterium]